MNVFFTILLAVLAFGFLIFVHELGHYIAARATGIKVYEFSIGMGPKLVWYDSKKTGIRYKICMIPLGGYVSMADGEDDAAPSDDPKAFSNQKPWRRLIVTVAGGIVNLVVGVVLMFVVVCGSVIPSKTVEYFPADVCVSELQTDNAQGLADGDWIYSVENRRVVTANGLVNWIAQNGGKPCAVTVYRDTDGDGKREKKLDLTVTFPTKLADDGQTVYVPNFTPVSVYPEGSTHLQGLKVGDEIHSIGGKRIYTAFEMDYEIMRRGTKPLKVVVLRDTDGDGDREKVTLDVTFPTSVTEGQRIGMADFGVSRASKTPGVLLRETFFRSVCLVRMVWESLFDLVTGRYGIEAVSGPVGIAGTMSEAASYGVIPFLYLISMISINLGVINLFPLPALDGGRLVFILIEMIFRKPVPHKIEARIHSIALIALLLFSVLIAVLDVKALF